VFGADGSNVVRLTDVEKNWLKTHPIIRLAPDPKFHPIEFFDNKGDYAGMGADYVRLIEKKLDIRFEIVKCPNWEDVISRIKRREVDVLNAVVKTPQRERYLTFPLPYLIIPSVIIVRKTVDRELSLDMLNGMRVVMVSGYGYVDLMHNKYPQIEIELVSDLKTALRKVSFGMADAFVGDLATASSSIESEGITNLKIAGETEPPNISGFAVRSDWPEFSRILEKGIALLTEKERKEIQRKWIHLESESVLTMREFRNLMMGVAVAILLIIFCFLFWTRTLRRAVHLRTEDLQKEVEERKQAERALKKSEERYRNILDNIDDGYFEVDIAGNLIFFNDSMCKILGYPRDELMGMNNREYMDGENTEKIYQAYNEIYRTGIPAKALDWKFIRKDGSGCFVETVVSLITDSNNKGIGFRGIARDVSDRKQLEAQFRQAQKMESVGRLAGGVAHDYNNALSVIIGFTEMAIDDVDPSGPVRADLNEVLNAAKRATDITRQLLAFARKQIIAPKVIELNKNVERMLNMLRRLIGEDIDLAWLPATNLWPVKMDPSQLDQILANLCVNARDAIEDVGKITIETRNTSFDAAYCADHAGFVPGEFVMLAVSDNGYGMEKEILDNIFEPFFTTKDVHKGTGLGLATIYGIAKQNNGFINVYSEPGKGTTFRIYLPRHEGKTVEIQEESAAEIPQGRGETVLLVEDDVSILKLAQKILDSLGYTVLAAGTPADAIDLAMEHADEINLLITDVIMPEMNGRELAEKLQSFSPKIKRMFMSGYTANVIAHHGVLDEGVRFIQKPFSRKDLAIMVRKALDE
jgi:two-component system sensor histidine kinase EvgS